MNHHGIWTGILICLFLRQPGYSQTIDIQARPVQHEPSRRIDALQYTVRLTFDLDKREFHGSNTVTMISLRDGLGSIPLNAVDLTVEKITGAGDRNLAFSYRDDTLRIVLPHPATFGDTLRMTIWYHGSYPAKGLYFDDSTSRHPRVVTTDSWPDEARCWFPCYDYPHDKAVQEMIITVPDTLKVLSNGALIGVRADGEAGTATWHYFQRHPHSTYLSMLAIGPYTVIADSLGPLPISYWVYPGDAENAKRIFKDTPNMIAFFNRIYNYPYPWDKYDQVVSPRQGGGAEATSATILGEGVIYDRRAEQDFSWERIIAHEIAHQWWGDLITLRSWEHTWMNEGFGTYSDYLYTRFARGDDEGAMDLLGKKNQYLNEAHTRYMRPIVCTRYNKPQDNFDSHTYPKAAAVLHMLRFVLGDKPFFETLSRFLHRHAFMAVDTHDFMSAVKNVTGRNLDWFFEQWIYKPGHPVLDISYAYDPGNGLIALKVRQVQDTSLGIPVYRMPVRIGVVTARGKEVHDIWLSKAEEIFTLPAADAPLLVRFDEGNYLLKEWTFRKSMQELIYQLQHDDVIGRQWAVARLGECTADRTAIKALSRAAQQDPFWAVRKQAAESLGTIASRETVSLFRRLAADPSSQVRASALTLLGATGRRDLVPFLKSRFQSDDSYRAQAAALRAIGACGGEADMPFLEQAASLASYRDIVNIAAEAAIKQISGN
ncbi:M1 family metallopeptidase [bacterium]|nr:M1 family metallopeptidase [bacterium]